ncbi:Glucosamine-6-phosphate deaminase [Candidatus Arthromitus sp. SFB-mouse-SU]|uniref:glucosamine-6-phosphate deaminase n=1 Tax=Candidatus Arthromitus sp. SFB-mouse TaxID=49118 RepID=UPI0002250E8C|nr:glucosamine-6-phosphate deaminase [Candidatus Arthromitus sp. SFB-mouse]EIA22053.1 Glucosamine-6-phosphate deaminase [Candidatus Arthromitus sp. SFB-1]EIA22945.1 Glucosamine-6-phosphate deaminase [Candidatus Arthromitus sp. SFB-3]EIA25715.1 Glucosamine-6-phosphate deaminase [Candidatus Arthromitus sp. SFB-4]EIA27090.1 Glucosamine-6-phosphate deaminase [Candidatus Arthromitus sp. SFB-co]EIA31196.1 Glucosamine-6-phosphate deaminase [Candidatus Arthromitus sp. SFB-mouse-SU]
MKTIVVKNSDEACKKASDIICSVVRDNKNALLGLATGGTAEGVYKYIVEEFKNGKIDLSNVKTINLDEYVGIGGDHPQSYRRYMDDHFFNHVNINKENTYVPITTGDIDRELLNIKEIIDGNGGTDIQLLGVGRNGHIAFNEPGERLNASASIVDLNEDTIRANSRYFSNIDEVPKKALSLGIGDILKSKKIILLAFGSEKANAIRELLSNDFITTKVPCTLLKAHNDVTIIIDEALSEKL